MSLPNRVIALEEHFVTPELKRHLDALGSPNLIHTPQFMEDGLIDVSEARLADMDRLGIDIQVLSHRPPGAQFADPEFATAQAVLANDALANAIDRHPDRFAGFATLPTSAPEAAASELRRCVETLGFKGAMVHGRAGGAFLDHPELDPILRTAAELEVPLFLHPGEVDAVVRDLYYDHLTAPADIVESVEVVFAGPGWGWHVEAGLHGLRLILSGVFDRYPDLQIILGHWGEMVPFFILRVDQVMGRVTEHLKRAPSDYFRDNYFVTPSGLETVPQLQHAMAVVGPERIMYALDYPFIPGTLGRVFLDEAPISDADKALIAHGNAERLLRIAAL